MLWASDYLHVNLYFYTNLGGETRQRKGLSYSCQYGSNLLNRSEIVAIHKRKCTGTIPCWSDKGTGGVGTLTSG